MQQRHIYFLGAQIENSIAKRTQYSTNPTEKQRNPGGTQELMLM